MKQYLLLTFLLVLCGLMSGCLEERVDIQTFSSSPGDQIQGVRNASVGDHLYYNIYAFVNACFGQDCSDAPDSISNDMEITLIQSPDGSRPETVIAQDPNNGLKSYLYFIPDLPGSYTFQVHYSSVVEHNGKTMRESADDNFEIMVSSLDSSMPLIEQTYASADEIGAGLSFVKIDEISEPYTDVFVLNSEQASTVTFQREWLLEWDGMINVYSYTMTLDGQTYPLPFRGHLVSVESAIADTNADGVSEIYVHVQHKALGDQFIRIGVPH